MPLDLAWPDYERPAFLIDRIHAELLANGHRTAGGDQFAPAPVVRLFTPDAKATWLLTEINPDDEDQAFGLCDLGLDMPELGWVSLSELATRRGPLGQPIERDEWFKANGDLASYATRARIAGRIVT